MAAEDSSSGGSPRSSRLGVSSSQLWSSTIFHSPDQMRRQRQSKGFWVNHLRQQPVCVRGHFRIQFSELQRSSSSSRPSSPPEGGEEGKGTSPALSQDLVLARDTQAILFLHALCLQLYNDLGFQQFLMDFFTATSSSAQPRDSDREASAPPPVSSSPDQSDILDVITLHLNAYDCIVDYNPL